MPRFTSTLTCSALAATILVATSITAAPEDETDVRPATPPRAVVDGNEPGFRDLGEADFKNVNGKPDTWSWNGNAVNCTGDPV
ncbi:MAG: hypothetical protein GY895_19320, partial [Phycisphaera sp.]|nr:hypothetical protein [Phycisphaera sp.]